MINCVITVDEWIKFAGKGVVMIRHLTLILALETTVEPKLLQLAQFSKMNFMDSLDDV